MVYKVMISLIQNSDDPKVFKHTNNVIQGKPVFYNLYVFHDVDRTGMLRIHYVYLNQPVCNRYAHQSGCIAYAEFVHHIVPVGFHSANGDK